MKEPFRWQRMTHYSFSPFFLMSWKLLDSVFLVFEKSEKGLAALVRYKGEHEKSIDWGSKISL
jgi:hypothetical protein